MRVAAIAASLSAMFSHFEPFRVFPDRRLPADWSLPGHCPAHDARCWAVGNTLMSRPISAITFCAVPFTDPGDRAQQRHRARC